MSRSRVKEEDMSNQRPHSEFTDVDSASNPSDYLLMLDAQRAIPFIQQYKQRVRALLDLHPGQTVLEAGSGTGEDAQEMAKRVAPGGQVVGLDMSQIMIDEARRRLQEPSLLLRFVRGDIQHLPFEDATFDRSVADRTFIHLPDPARALSELVRVTKPGGQILIAEGDHESQVLDSPYPDVTRRFFRWRSDGMCQPDIAHRLYALFQDAGLQDVQVEPLARLTTDYETIRPVAHYIEGMKSAERCGVVTAQEAEQWIRSLEEAMRTGRFFHAILWFLTIGRKPS
jgi:ubiquinone/menaquinone biosynthesis C-methylase UbiE